jgi:hypothetical protein
MRIEKLRLLHTARPFRPFVIHLADGRHIPVEHPEFLAQSPSGRTIYVETSGDKGHHIDLLLVTDLEVDTNGSAGSNGRQRRRR